MASSGGKSRTPQSGSSQRRGQAWLCTSGLQSDVVVEVEQMSFHLHKFPLVSRSRHLAKLVEEASKEDEDSCLVRLENFPGGTHAFELAAKFCYGVKVEFTAYNIVALRCAAEFLEMTEDLGVENLIERSEDFLQQVVLHNWSDSIAALQSCTGFYPMAEELGLVDRLIDSVCTKASMNDSSRGGWPMQDHRSLQSPGGSLLWNGISTGARARVMGEGENWWYEDISVLSLAFFEKVILGMESVGVRGESIWGAVVHYAKKGLPGLNRRHSGREAAHSQRKGLGPANPLLQENDQRILLETIESLLPPLKVSSSTRFLFGLLRLAIIINASPQCKSSLEKRIGMQLEQVTLDELLVPNYSHVEETLYDIDLVQRVLDHYLMLEQNIPPESDEEGLLLGSPSLCPIMMVAKLLDAYLAEIAPDVNLKPSKFQALAEALPDYSRLVDDGLYRAIDVYLKAHPWLSEAEREMVCKIMSCQKLSLEACTHAAQNERLPLRVVVQVLFFEQLQLRNAIAGSFLVADTVGQSGRQQGGQNPLAPGGARQGESWENSMGPNSQALKDDMGKILARVSQLEIECGSMRQEIENLHRSKKPLNTLSKAFGCKMFSAVVPSTGEISNKGQGRNVGFSGEQVQ
ncbi:hypothetical protein KC19_12G095400 [Ceratodon purpureus]|uniref:BTB/POZ domain-containing protein n=1 Tax=Ceratodon purpureus TaxID=3225 RepID=A0A8T0G7N0_CERPU|nr:hypothetical protein KC19_12G095400 [Ceratodon purpureus]